MKKQVGLKAEGEISLHKVSKHSVVPMPGCLEKDVPHSDYQIPHCYPAQTSFKIRSNCQTSHMQDSIHRDDVSNKFISI